jgi:hypothetical protein
VSVLWEETIQWTCSRFGEFDQAPEGTNVIDWVIIGSILSFVDHEIADRCQSALHHIHPSHSSPIFHLINNSQRKNELRKHLSLELFTVRYNVKLKVMSRVLFSLFLIYSHFLFRFLY